MSYPEESVARESGDFLALAVTSSHECVRARLAEAMAQTMLFKMKHVLPLFVAASPVFGWEASVAPPVCLLTHETETAEVIVSYDPRDALPYAMQLIRKDTNWADGTVFSIRFDGPGALTISTDRHRVSKGTLSVADTGFGNVLNGLEFNEVATAVLGDQSVVLPLDGAAPEVQKFRNCGTSALS